MTVQRDREICALICRSSGIKAKDILLNPGEEEWYYYGIQDSTDLFAIAGNEFYSFTESAAG